MSARAMRHAARAAAWNGANRKQAGLKYPLRRYRDASELHKPCRTSKFDGFCRPSLELARGEAEISTTGDSIARIAAFQHLEGAPAAQAQTTAVAYQLMSKYTNCVLVHQRPDREKAIDAAELHRVTSMLAAGWGGTSSNQRLGFGGFAEPFASPFQGLPFIAANVKHPDVRMLTRPPTPSDGQIGYRCTVCGTHQPIVGLGTPRMLDRFEPLETWSDEHITVGQRQRTVVRCRKCTSTVWLRECERTYVLDPLAKAAGWDSLAPEEIWSEFAALNAVVGPSTTRFYPRIRPVLRQYLLEPRTLQDPPPPVRRRDDLAKEYIWWDNDRDRFKEFPRKAGGFRSELECERRNTVLQALVEYAWSSLPDGEQARVSSAEWLREACEWDLAREVLKEPFKSGELADLAAQLRVLVDCQIGHIVVFDLSPEMRSSLQIERDQKWQREREVEEQRKADLRLKTAPRAFLQAVLDHQGALSGMETLRAGLPSKLITIMEANIKGYFWDPSTVPLAICQALVKLCGWPPGIQAKRFDEVRGNEKVDARLVDFLVHAFRGSSWNDWEYSPVGQPPPRYLANR